MKGQIVNTGRQAGGGISRRFIHAALKLSIYLIPLGNVSAQALPPNLVQLNTRIFDVRVDATTLHRDPDFIPLNRARWLGNFLESDPIMDGAVFHINVLQQPVYQLWKFPGPGNLYKHSERIPERLQFTGYRGQAAAPVKLDRLIRMHYLPDSADPDHAASCSTTTTGGKLTFCVVYANYPPDPNIFLKARIYDPARFENGNSSFEAIAKRMRQIAYCLDVTETVNNRAGEQTESELPFEGEFDLSKCPVPIS